jgi:hypothetical protein
MGRKKDLTIITIHSDGIDEKQLKTMKKQFKKAMPGRKVAIIGVGREDNVTVNTVRG